jgi:hypothetical protein
MPKNDSKPGLPPRLFRELIFILLAKRRKTYQAILDCSTNSGKRGNTATFSKPEEKIYISILNRKSLFRNSDLTGPWPPSSILNRNWKEVVVGKVEFFVGERIVLTRKFDPLDDL